MGELTCLLGTPATSPSSPLGESLQVLPLAVPLDGFLKSLIFLCLRGGELQWQIVDFLGHDTIDVVISGSQYVCSIKGGKFSGCRNLCGSQSLS